MNTDATPKSLFELLKVYHAIPGAKPVKRFVNKAQALKRIEEALTKNEKAVVLEPRPNTKRALALELIRKGVPYEKMRDEVGWNDRQAREAVRILKRMGHDVGGVAVAPRLASEVLKDAGVKLTTAQAELVDKALRAKSGI